MLSCDEPLHLHYPVRRLVRSGSLRSRSPLEHAVVSVGVLHPAIYHGAPFEQISRIIPEGARSATAAYLAGDK